MALARHFYEVPFGGTCLRRVTSLRRRVSPPLFGSAEEGAILYNRMGEMGGTSRAL